MRFYVTQIIVAIAARAPLGRFGKDPWFGSATRTPCITQISNVTQREVDREKLERCLASGFSALMQGALRLLLTFLNSLGKILQYARPKRYKSQVGILSKTQPQRDIPRLRRSRVVKEKKYERSDENQMADRR